MSGWVGDRYALGVATLFATWTARARAHRRAAVRWRELVNAAEIAPALSASRVGWRLQLRRRARYDRVRFRRAHLRDTRTLFGVDELSGAIFQLWRQWADGERLRRAHEALRAKDSSIHVSEGAWWLQP